MMKRLRLMTLYNIFQRLNPMMGKHLPGAKTALKCKDSNTSPTCLLLMSCPPQLTYTLMSQSTDRMSTSVQTPSTEWRQTTEHTAAHCTLHRISSSTTFRQWRSRVKCTSFTEQRIILWLLKSLFCVQATLAYLQGSFCVINLLICHSDLMKFANNIMQCNPSNDWMTNFAIISTSLHRYKVTHLTVVLKDSSNESRTNRLILCLIDMWDESKWHNEQRTLNRHFSIQKPNCFTVQDTAYSVTNRATDSGERPGRLTIPITILWVVTAEEQKQRGRTGKRGNEHNDSARTKNNTAIDS